MSLIINIVGTFASLLSITSLVPQVLKARHKGRTRDLSIGMFSMKSTASILWVIYGFAIDSYILGIEALLMTTLYLIVFMFIIRDRSICNKKNNTMEPQPSLTKDMITLSIPPPKDIPVKEDSPLNNNQEVLKPLRMRRHTNLRCINCEDNRHAEYYSQTACDICHGTAWNMCGMLVNHAGGYHYSGAYVDDELIFWVPHYSNHNPKINDVVCHGSTWPRYAVPDPIGKKRNQVKDEDINFVVFQKIGKGYFMFNEDALFLRINGLISKEELIDTGNKEANKNNTDDCPYNTIRYMCVLQRQEYLDVIIDLDKMNQVLEETYNDAEDLVQLKIKYVTLT